MIIVNHNNLTLPTPISFNFDPLPTPLLPTLNLTPNLNLLSPNPPRLQIKQYSRLPRNLTDNNPSLAQIVSESRA